MITVICARGISEPRTNNMISEVTKHLDKKKYNLIELDYTAAYGPIGNQPFGFSQTEGRAELRRQIEKAPGKVVLLGFSAGAQLTGDVAKSIADGVFPGWRNKVVGVGLLADPSRSKLQIQGQDRGGYGIVGDRFISNKYFPVWQFSAPGDPISELPVGNPLRSIPDLSYFLWARDPRVFFNDLYLKAKDNRFQRWWDVKNITSWNGAVHWLSNYLFKGRHVCYGVENWPGFNITYTKRLAQLIEIHAR